MRGSLRAVVEDVLDHGMKGTPSRARRQLLGRDVKPPVGFTLPWAGAAAPAPAVRRRENLRSASFRDYAREEPQARAAPGRWHGWPVKRAKVTLAPNGKTKMRPDGLLRLFLCHSRAKRRIPAPSCRV